MSVEDWAREQAEKKHPTPGPVDWNVGASVAVERNNFADGIVHAFSALLSDEAVEAMAEKMLGWANLTEFEARRPDYLADVRAALQAAIQTVTEGDIE